MTFFPGEKKRSHSSLDLIVSLLIGNWGGSGSSRDGSCPLHQFLSLDRVSSLHMDLEVALLREGEGAERTNIGTFTCNSAAVNHPTDVYKLDCAAFHFQNEMQISQVHLYSSTKVFSYLYAFSCVSGENSSG